MASKAARAIMTDDDSGRIKITDRDRATALNREILRTEPSVRFTPGMAAFLDTHRSEVTAALIAEQAAQQTAALRRYAWLMAAVASTTAALSLAFMIFAR